MYLFSDLKRPDCNQNMFENIVWNIKNKSFRVSDSLSVESLKGKTSRFSETVCNFGSTLIHKTNSLSSYLSVDQFINKKDVIVNDEYAKTSMSTPNLVHNIPNGIQSEMRWPTVINNKSDYVIYNPMAEDEYDDDDIVNRFVRVINVEEETPPHRRYARRNDREEIRRRLATGCDTDEYYGGDRPGRKPSLQARLQSGMNLQICFMNDTMSDTESPSSDTEPPSAKTTPSKQPAPAQPPPPPLEKQTQHTINTSNKCARGGLTLPLNQSNEVQTEADFFARQARLQAEARIALAQAKDMARLQMEVERQRRQTSPITDMLRATLHKVGIVFPQDRRRVSRQMLTDMNVAQLQVIVNDLHTQIEYLNESLVKFLMERDDLHMGQDSMLVDIEDLTRYLGAKENTLKEDFSHNNNVILSKPKLNRIAGLVRK